MRKFKKGDVVRTKPAEVVSVHAGMVLCNMDGCECISIEAEHLEPVPPLNQEAAEKAAQPLTQEWLQKQIAMTEIIEWKETAQINQELYLSLCKMALKCVVGRTALEATRSPKPDVNQMMLEALKGLENVDDAACINFELCERDDGDSRCVASFSLGQIRAAIAAGSGE